GRSLMASGLRERLIGILIATINSSACSPVARAKRPQAEPRTAPPASITPATMTRVGTVHERFQSFNIEMLEVTGGKFWKPYRDIEAKATKSSSATQAGDVP